jgi:hypothetical protein
MLDSIQVKKRLTQHGLTDNQAEGLAEEIATLTESQLVTKEHLEERLGWWALYIVGTNLAGTAALLALYGFAA